MHFSLLLAAFLHSPLVLNVVGVNAEGAVLPGGPLLSSRDPDTSPSHLLALRSGTDDTLLDPIKSFGDDVVTPGFTDWTPDAALRGVTCPGGYGYCKKFKKCCRLGGYCCNGTKSCCNPGYHCCSAKGCCQNGYNCVKVDGQNGCCPIGKRCVRNGPCKTAGWKKCKNENFCCPPGYTCYRDSKKQARCRKNGSSHLLDLQPDATTTDDTLTMTSEAPPTSSGTGDGTDDGTGDGTSDDGTDDGTSDGDNTDDTDTDNTDGGDGSSSDVSATLTSTITNTNQASSTSLPHTTTVTSAARTTSSAPTTSAAPNAGGRSYATCSGYPMLVLLAALYVLF